MKLLLLVTIFATSVFSQERDPKELLDLILSKYNKITDYSVDVEIILDVSFLDTSISKGKLFFKPPDKIKIESDEFTIIPKQGLTFAPSELLEDSYSAIFIKTEIIESFMVDVIKVMPLVDSSNILLSTLWVDPLYNVVRKIESVTRKMGAISIKISYDDKSTPLLPSVAKFHFNISNSEYNMMFMNDHKIKNIKENGKISGRIIINYSNYLLNQNLEDSIFEEDDELEF